MANAYRFSPDEIQMANEIWIDTGRDKAASVERLCENGLGRSKAYELIRVVISDDKATESVSKPGFDFGLFILQEYKRMIESQDFSEEKLRVLEGMTNACSKLKIRIGSEV